MLPNGIAGIQSTPDHVREFRAFAARACGTEQEFHSVSTEDGTCILGMVASDASKPYMSLEHVGEHGLAARDGFAFTPSRCIERPSALHAEDLQLPDEANGMFAAASWDGRSLRLLTDPWSTIPLYYRSLPDGWAFASQLRLLLDLPWTEAPEYDRRGLAQFLCWREILDGSTLYQGVRKLQGAELLETSADGIVSARYWNPSVRPSASKDTVEVCVEAFAQAVRRSRNAVPGTHAAALSGGMDSRVICAVLGPEAGMPAITHARTMGHDARIAKHVAERLGFRHVMTMLDEGFEGEMEKHFAETLQGSNGLLPAHNAHLPFVYRAAARHADVLWDGIITTMEGRWALRTGTRGIRDRTDFVSRLWNMIYVPGLDAANTLLSREEAHEVAYRVLHDLAHDPADSASPGCAADEFNMRWRVPNHGVDAGLLQNHYLRFLSPYLDLDYVAAVAAVPDHTRWKQATQYATLKRFAPGLLRIPRSYTDIRTIPVGSIYVQLLPVAVQRLLLDRLQASLPVSLRSVLDRRSVSMRYDDLLASLTDAAAESRASSVRIAELFDPDRFLALAAPQVPIAIRAWLPALLHPDGPLR